MDELIRNLAPPVGVLLFLLFAWWNVRRIHRQRSSHDAAE
jgi:flagellar biogenesis protein FliO